MAMEIMKQDELDRMIRRLSAWASMHGRHGCMHGHTVEIGGIPAGVVEKTGVARSIDFCIPESHGPRMLEANAHRLIEIQATADRLSGELAALAEMIKNYADTQRAWGNTDATDP